MKKFVIVTLILALFAAPIFALDFGLQYSKQLEGFEKDFFGVTVKLFEEKFLGLDVVALIPSLTNYTDPLENLMYLASHSDSVNSAELLPYLRMNLKLKPFWLYVGVAPVLDLSFPLDAWGNRQFDVNVRTPFTGAAKAGVQLNLFILGAYAEVGTFFNTDLDVYDLRANLGAVINF
jgi:hypothetical protein